MSRSIRIPAREAEVVLEADVVVAGGGPAGLGAALAAARSGASVALLERYGFLGGNLTAAAVGTVCGLYVRSGGDFDFVTGGLAKAFAESLQSKGAAMGPFPFKETAVLLYVPWEAKRLADHLVEESGIDLLLHALVSDVVLDESGAVEALVVASKQGPKAITGRVFVDATGDADVAVAAGVPWEMGGSGQRQFGSMQFFVQRADTQAALTAGLARLTEEMASNGAHLSRDGGAVIPTFRPGEMIGAMIRLARQGEPLDATDLRDLTYGELEGRRRAEEAIAFLREHMPGFEEAFLADTATQQGVRETRHVVGEYTLSGSDVTGLARFDDAIASSAWPQEYHTAGRSTEYTFLPDASAYQIPYRSLVPQGPPNLLVAGRCISADHDALASCRVMAPCMAMGEAAGTAAAMAVREDSNVQAVDAAPLREELAAHGAILSL